MGKLRRGVKPKDQPFPWPQAMLLPLGTASSSHRRHHCQLTLRVKLLLDRRLVASVWTEALQVICRDRIRVAETWMEATAMISTTFFCRTKKLRPIKTTRTLLTISATSIYRPHRQGIKVRMVTVSYANTTIPYV